MPRILVVDDNAAVLSAVVTSLRNQGHEVTSTNSGEDAICLLANKPAPDLLILDLGMPGTNGFAVLHSLGTISPAVIVITGSSVDEVEFVGGKVARVLRKPFDQDALLATVADVLKSSPPLSQDVP